VVSGIGQAFQARATTTAISPLGAVSSLTDGKELEAGLSTGVGRAMDRLAQYYITLAEKTFPVIEVDAGRTVDVVLTQGVTIDVPDDATDQSTDVSTENTVVRRPTIGDREGGNDEE
jgi:conjugal transfer pilus assembly protein TraB